MPSDFEVRGGEQFGKLARELKQAGAKDLRRELYRGLTVATRPMTAAVKTEAVLRLPDRFAVELARSLRVSTRKHTGRDPGITLIGKAVSSSGKPRNLRALERGVLRHPVFGNRARWVNQDVDRGWWSEPLERTAPRVRGEVERVIGDVTRKLERTL